MAIVGLWPVGGSRTKHFGLCPANQSDVIRTLPDDQLFQLKRFVFKLNKAMVDHVTDGHHADQIPVLHNRHVTKPATGHPL